MWGYKMMESDMTCKGFQYEIDKEYTLEGKLEICRNGYHFCETPFDCLKYYNNIKGDKRLFLVEVLGEVISQGDKLVTNKIKIIEEIPDIKKFFDNNLDDFEIKWVWFSKYQKLSESFIEKYIYKVEWDDISAYQTLSEEFIEKHVNKIN